MTKAQILSEIAEYEELLSAPDVPENTKEIARDEIADLRGQLAALNAEPPAPAAPAAKRKGAGRPKAEKPERKPRKIKEAFDGPHLDANGHEIKVGAPARAKIKDEWVEGNITHLKKSVGGGYGFQQVGKKGVVMLPPTSIKVQVTAAVSTEEKMPTALIQKAVNAGRRDCDENEIVLVKPTEAVEVQMPTVADPANGDMVAVNKQGFPMYVVEGDAVKADYAPSGEAKSDVSGGKVQKFKAKPAEKPAPASDNDDDGETEVSTVNEDKVKAKRPTASCEYVTTADAEGAIKTFMEGMRRQFRDGDTTDKITKVYWLKDLKKVLLQIRVYDWLQIVGREKYFMICPDSGKLTKAVKPNPGFYKVLFDEAEMRDFYRYPNQNSCRRISRKLYRECYREGNCSDGEKAKLYKLFAGSCRKRETELTVAHAKWTHRQAAQKWNGYNGKKSYHEVWREVIDGIRKSGKPLAD